MQIIFYHMPGKKVNKKYIISIFALLLILMYALCIFNSSVYLHTHILASGKVVTHAHPYDKNSDNEPYKTHKHSFNQIMTLDNMQLLFTVFLLAICLLKIEKKKFTAIYLRAGLRSAHLIRFQGRDPPL